MGKYPAQRASKVRAEGMQAITEALTPATQHNTYTKDAVLRRFKDFYVREYGRMDNRAYTVCGYLLSALD